MNKLLFGFALIIILFFLFFPDEAKETVHFIKNYSISSTFDYTAILDGKVDWNSSVEEFNGDYSTESKKSTRVFDKIGLLSDADVTAINEKANSFENKYDADFIVITSANAEDPYSEANHFYKHDYIKKYQRKNYKNAVIVVLTEKRYYIYPLGYVKNKLAKESGRVSNVKKNTEITNNPKISFLDVLFTDASLSKYATTTFNAFGQGAVAMISVKRDILLFSIISWIIINSIAGYAYNKIRYREETNERGDPICKKLISHARHVVIKQ